MLSCMQHSFLLFYTTFFVVYIMKLQRSCNPHREILWMEKRQAMLGTTQPLSRGWMVLCMARKRLAVLVVSVYGLLTNNALAVTQRDCRVCPSLEQSTDCQLVEAALDSDFLLVWRSLNLILPCDQRLYVWHAGLNRGKKSKSCPLRAAHYCTSMCSSVSNESISVLKASSVKLSDEKVPPRLR